MNTLLYDIDKSTASYLGQFPNVSVSLAKQISLTDLLKNDLSLIGLLPFHTSCRKNVNCSFKIVLILARNAYFLAFPVFPQDLRPRAAQALALCLTCLSEFFHGSCS